MFFRGWITNLSVLARELTSRLQRMVMETPEEVVPAAFSLWGKDAFAKLRGSFVFSFTDEGSGKRYLVCDPMGTIPLYYYVSNPELHDVSVRQLLNKGVERRLDPEGLISYLTYGAVQEPSTLVQGVKSLPPGHCLEVKEGAQPICYWRPTFQLQSWTRDDLQVAVSETLEAATREALGDDESPASFLSGGIDSSAVVAMLRKVHSGRLRTFCVTHEDPRSDERQWAQMVASHHATEHTELLLTSAMIKELIPQALNDYDQPSLDGLNMWFASKLVRDTGVERIFSGTGGDELFMGYGCFAKHQMAYRYGRWLKYVPKALGQAVTQFAPNERLRKLGMLMGYKGDPYFVPRQIFSPSAVKALLARDYKCSFATFPMLGEDAPTNDLLNHISWLEMRTSLLSMYLRDGYQTSVAHGLSVALPLLDARLVELLLSAEGCLKCDARTPKPLLVNAVQKGIPEACIYRRKQGFSLPFDLYFREVLRTPLLDFFEGNSMLFDKAQLRMMWQAYLAGRTNWSRIWALYMIEDWCKRNRLSWE